MKLRALPIVLLPLMNPGCESRNCTAAGCSNGVFISIRTADDSLPLEGAIDSTLDLDGEVWEISCPSTEVDCEASVNDETVLGIWPHRGLTGMSIDISANARGDMPETFLLQVSVGRRAGRRRGRGVRLRDLGPQRPRVRADLHHCRGHVHDPPVSLSGRGRGCSATPSPSRPLRGR